MKKTILMFLGLVTLGFTQAQINLPLTFEGAGPYNWTNFDGGVTTVIANPQNGGINTSGNVGRTVKGPGGQPWGGSWTQLTNAIDFSTQKFMRMKVFSTSANRKVLLKVENKDNPAQFFQRDAIIPSTNEWVDLTFDFSAINTVNSYHKVVIIFQEGTIGQGGADWTFLFDDIRQENAPPGALKPPTLPITFDDPTVNNTFVNFDGGDTKAIVNPHKMGLNTTDSVARMIKNAGAVWAGSKLLLGQTLDFTTKKLFRVLVFSPRIGAKFTLKVEGDVPTFEKDALTTKANEWEELVFDYTGVNLTKSFNQLVFILDLGTMGNGSANFTILFDNIRLEEAGGGALSQMNLPVTFEDPTVNYGLIGFGGADNSTIVQDPTNPANKVARVVKSQGAQDWAGTTVSAPGGGGFATKIPFSPGNTFMNVRVWSPLAGIPVRLKVEDSNDNTKSVETEALTTVAGGWQNLVFDFTVPTVPPTAPINFTFNYNKASIFFNYGPGGATVERTYYFDDMAFGSSPLPVNLTSFTAEKSGDEVLISWSTATETKNKEFGVERSGADGKWLEIAKVKGAGNSNSVRNYSIFDRMPISGIGFYRLRQTDFDGTTVYSDIRKVDFTGLLTNGFKVYPNPASSRVLVLSNQFSGKVQYSLVNPAGTAVQEGFINNPVSETGIDISRLQGGMYILKLTDGKNTRIQKIMVR